MATFPPGDHPPVSFSSRLPSPVERGTGTFAPPYGVAGPGDEVAARTHQLSILVEVNAALAGALDVESVLEESCRAWRTASV